MNLGLAESLSLPRLAAGRSNVEPENCEAILCRSARDTSSCIESMGYQQTSPFRRIRLDGSSGSGRFRPLEHRRSSDSLDAGASAAYGSDALCSPLGRISFPASGTRNSDSSEQSDLERVISDPDLLPYATSGSFDLSDCDCAL